ncbi:hypothetical protein SDC9_91782 [bioreactor metagenome]|uniref:YlzJ-like protein n=1 Tax=bioreactor metagenome TaxID=1076179 RepID=A0A644ZWG8_9ZZZZ
MILWTVMPLELVFGQQDVSNPYEEIDYAGTKMMVEKMPFNQCRVVRILSSNPMDYLRSDIQPGVVLSYQPMA